MQRVRGIRGATTVEQDTKELLLDAARELLEQIIAENDVVEEEVACVFFTTTPDLTAEFPAQAARKLGWAQTALLGASEMNVPDGLAKCLRVLLLVNTDKDLGEIHHIYLRGAKNLRLRGLGENESVGR